MEKFNNSNHHELTTAYTGKVDPDQLQEGIRMLNFPDFHQFTDWREYNNRRTTGEKLPVDLQAYLNTFTHSILQTISNWQNLKSGIGHDNKYVNQRHKQASRLSAIFAPILKKP